MIKTRGLCSNELALKQKLTIELINNILVAAMSNSLYSSKLSDDEFNDTYEIRYIFTRPTKQTFESLEGDVKELTLDLNAPRWYHFLKSFLEQV